MITFKNCISNLNFNHILFGFILFSFFYIKYLINKLINLHNLNIIILNKFYKKIKKIIKKNNNFYLKNMANIESNKVLEVKPSTPINNTEQNQSNCITVDVENEFEFIE